MPFLPAHKQLTILERGVEEIVPHESLLAKLEESIQRHDPLAVKLWVQH